MVTINCKWDCLALKNCSAFQIQDHDAPFTHGVLMIPNENTEIQHNTFTFLLSRKNQDQVAQNVSDPGVQHSNERSRTRGQFLVHPPWSDKHRCPTFAAMSSAGQTDLS